MIHYKPPPNTTLLAWRPECSESERREILDRVSGESGYPVTFTQKVAGWGTCTLSFGDDAPRPYEVELWEILPR